MSARLDTGWSSPAENTAFLSPCSQQLRPYNGYQAYFFLGQSGPRFYHYPIPRICTPSCNFITWYLRKVEDLHLRVYLSACIIRNKGTTIKGLQLSTTLSRHKGLGHGVLTFYGEGPHPLLWVGSRPASGKITISGNPNRLNYCVIFIVYI
jgi:hypothetical protein